MRIIKIFFLIGIYVICTFMCRAQSFDVKSVSLKPMDLTAIEHPVMDNNGDTCALLKIKIEHLQGVEFTNKNQYVKAGYEDGIYFVYVPTISRKLDISHKDYLPKQLDLSEYGFKRLKGGKTYFVVIEASIKNELKSKVVLNVEPKDAEVTFDKKNCPKEEGVYEFLVEPGPHQYVVAYDNYQEQNGVVDVGNSDVKTVTVRLQPITHLVRVDGNVKNARVIVDNNDYGKVGDIYLPQGMHYIRIIADGYTDFVQEVNVTKRTETISFSLEENHEVEHVHATPVTIISTGTKVFKNNKQIKEWTPGHNTVSLMPGKYQITDDIGGKEKIKVGTDSMEVYLEYFPQKQRTDTDSPNYSPSAENHQETTTNGQSSSYIDNRYKQRETTRGHTFGNNYNYNNHSESRTRSNTNNYNSQHRFTESRTRSNTNNNNNQRRVTESRTRSNTNDYNNQRRSTPSRRFGNPNSGTVGNNFNIPGKRK